MGGAASRCSGCLEPWNPRWALGGGGKSPLQEAPLARLASHVFPCPGLSAGGQTVQEEEDKTPGPQRCEGRGRPACLVAAGLPSGRGWQTRLQRLSPSPVPVSWGAGGRAPGSSCPSTALPLPRPSGWRWEWGFLSTSLSLHVPESLQTPSQGTEGRAGLT